MKLLENADVGGKKIFLRVDLDVPLADGKIDDDTRLLAAIPSIEYLLEKKAVIIIGGHLGRPKGLLDKTLSLEPIAKWFSLKLGFNIVPEKRGEFEGWGIGPDIFLLENLRFNPGEEANDPEFSKKLASLADIYVNDAFAMCHRKSCFNGRNYQVFASFCRNSFRKRD